MAKDDKKKKVHPRANPKYTASSDEGSSSDNEDDLLSLFANLSMLYNRRRPSIKVGIGFQQGNQNNTKLNAPKKLSNFVKGKAPMVQDSEGYILYPANYLEHKIRRIHAKKPHSVSRHAFMCKNEASSSRHSTHVKMPKRKTPNASNKHNISFKTFDASYVLTNKSGKIVAKYVGGKRKSSKTCVWVPKVLVLM
jgi:hypothetical protein